MRSDTVGGAGIGEAGETGALSRLESPADESQTPEDWAEIVTEALRSAEDPVSAAAASRESHSVFMVTAHLSATASRFNRAGTMDGAARIAERMLALGKRAVERYSAEATAHLALCQAYVQIYKTPIKPTTWLASK